MSVLYGSKSEKDLAYVDPQSITRPKAGLLENLSIGFDAGLKETSVAYIKDIALKESAKATVGQDGIAQEDWNETHPYYVQDIEWNDSLTNSVAQNIWEERSFQQEIQAISERSGVGGTATRFIGTFGGAMFDPVNLIPVGVGVKAADSLRKAILVGAATNALFEVPFSAAALYTQDVRGREIGAQEIGLNFLFSTVAGGSFSAIGAGVPKFYNWITRGKQPHTQADVDSADSLIKTDKTPKNTLVNQAKTFGVTSTVDTIKAGRDHVNEYLPYIKFDTFKDGDTVIIDSRGLKQDTNYSGGVKITITGNDIQLNGEIQDVIKILPTIQQNILNVENIKRILINDQSPVIKDDLGLAISTLEKKHNVVAKLDDAEILKGRVEIEGQFFDFEEDTVTGQIRNVWTTFVNKQGQRRRGKKLSQAEATPIIKKFENTVEQKRSFPNHINADQDAGAQAKTQTERIKQEDDQVKQSIEKTRDNDLQTAQDQTISENFATQSIIPGKSMSAVIEHNSISSNYFEAAGYRVETDENGFKQLIDLGAGASTNNDRRALIKTIIDLDQQNARDNVAEKNFMLCMNRTGSL